MLPARSSYKQQPAINMLPYTHYEIKDALDVGVITKMSVHRVRDANETWLC